MTAYQVDTDESSLVIEADSLNFSDSWVWVSKKEDDGGKVIALFRAERVIGIWKAEAQVGRESESDGE